MCGGGVTEGKFVLQEEFGKTVGLVGHRHIDDGEERPLCWREGEVSRENYYTPDLSRL